MLVSWVRRAIGIDSKGRPPLPNSRLQLLIGGIVCFAFHPGVLVVAISTGIVRKSSNQEIYLILNPWVIVTILGIWLVLLAALSSNNIIYNKNDKKVRKSKEIQ